MDINDRILAVDDNVDNLLILEEMLADKFTFKSVMSGEEALRVAPEFQPNLVLLDLMMPGLDGQETCRQLRDRPELRNAKIIMLSAKADLAARLAAYRVGAVDYIAKPFHDQEVLAKVQAWMGMMHREYVEEVWNELEATRDIIGVTLTSLAQLRDTETGEHLFRMRWYSQLLAEQLAIESPYREQVDEVFLRQLYRASPLHDIGKIGIDDAILRKPAKLTTAEYETIKQHTVIGAEILSRAASGLPRADYLKMAVPIARHHHERWDGSGYPDGLDGLSIPLAARIVAVADVFDAVTSDRVYRKAMPLPVAQDLIQQGAGTQFDATIVDAFIARFEDIRQAHAHFRDVLQSSQDSDLIGRDDVDNLNLRSIDHLEHLVVSEINSTDHLAQLQN